MSRMHNLAESRNAAVGLGTARRTGLLLFSGLLSLGSLPAIVPACAWAESATPSEQSAAHPYAAHIAEASDRFGLPEHWIAAVLAAESNGIVRAVSPAGAMGLMQIMPDTWVELSARHDLGGDPYDPRDNILAGAAYLRELHDNYGSPGFLAAYNAGPTRYDEFLVDGHPLPVETRNYVAVLAPYVDASADSLAAPPVQINRSDWTQSPLFVAQANSGATAVPARASGPPPTATETPIEETDERLAPRNSGLFVTPSQASERQRR